MSSPTQQSLHKWGDERNALYHPAFCPPLFPFFSQTPLCQMLPLEKPGHFLTPFSHIRVNKTETISPNCSFFFCGGCVSYYTGLFLFKSLSTRKRERRGISGWGKRGGSEAKPGWGMRKPPACTDKAVYYRERDSSSRRYLLHNLEEIRTSSLGNVGQLLSYHNTPLRHVHFPYRIVGRGKRSSKRKLISYFLWSNTPHGKPISLKAHIFFQVSTKRRENHVIATKMQGMEGTEGHPDRRFTSKGPSRTDAAPARSEESPKGKAWRPRKGPQRNWGQGAALTKATQWD